MKTEIIKRNTEVVQAEEQQKNLPKYWWREYINDCVDKIQNHNHKMLVLFLWMTGVRISEALNIKKKDIDFKKYLITIKWQKSKKGRYRNIPMHPNLKNMLDIYCAKLNQEDKIFPFTRQRALQITEKNLGGSPHKLRHSFAVNWLRCGGRLEILSKVMGHADIRQTMIYLDIVPIDQGQELLKIKF